MPKIVPLFKSFKEIVLDKTNNSIVKKFFKSDEKIRFLKESEVRNGQAKFI